MAVVQVNPKSLYGRVLKVMDLPVAGFLLSVTTISIIVLGVVVAVSSLYVK